MTRRILLCAEDALCAALARDLCDRVVAERARADWLRALWSAPSLRATQRAWEGLRPDAWWADRPALERECALRGIASNVRVRETGRRVAPHGTAAVAFRAARVAAALDPRPDLLVVAADTDGETDPALRLSGGLALAGEPLPTVAAEIHREAEAWVVAGFVPANADERARLRAVRDELGFDPTESPERLMSDREGDPRDAKRVARALLGCAPSPLEERARACWLDTPLEVLLARGERAGLARYAAEVERVLLPLLGDGGRARAT